MVRARDAGNGAPAAEAGPAGGMAGKLATEEGQRPLKLRERTLETEFGIVKPALGFPAFLLPRSENARGERSLVALSYNSRRLHVFQWELYI